MHTHTQTVKANKHIEDKKSTQKNWLYFYTLGMNDPKRKLRELHLQ